MKFKQVFCAALSIFFVGIVHADNYKKNYCGNEEYVANGKQYPHLHCDKKFFVYSADDSDHKYMAQGDNIDCIRTRTILDTIKNLGPTKIVGYNDVLNDTLAFARVHCKK